MVETTGKQLSKARLAKGLTIDEVAYETKLRPDKVLALEHDDYGRFPNNAYVKGFLQIYGRYLGVDVSGAIKELENPNPVCASDYQYLNNVPVPEATRLAARRPAKKPSLAPLIAFVLILILAAAGGYLYLNWLRLGNSDQSSHDRKADETVTSAANVNASGGANASGAGQAATPAPVPASPNAPAVVAAAKNLPSAPVPSAAVPASEATAQIKPVVSSDREFISQPTPSPVVTATVTMNEVVLEPVKKTWVIVKRDDPNSTPIFEDYLYTNAPPLKLRGARFFIELRDQGAVMIRKNGAPIAYQGSGVAIQ
jgi:cytoskeleton protein RodZ